MSQRLKADIKSNTEGASQGALLVVLMLAALAGAAGVGLAATAAHRIESPGLATAATMLMIHAVGVVALIAIAQRAASSRAWVMVAAFMLVSVSLFSGDIALNAIAGFHLFPRAAPIGGSLLIVSWLVAAGISVRDLMRAR